MPVIFVLGALALAVGVGSIAFARGASLSPGSATGMSQDRSDPNTTADAFAHFRPVNGAPSSGGTVAPGTKFTLDLYINTGSNRDVTAAQSYLTFDPFVLQVVSPSGNTCTPSQTVAEDTSTFDVALQNEVCNGPNPCTLRGMQVQGGRLAFASGALNNPNCTTGCGGDFRVASITFCAANGGHASLHWEFSPPAESTRDSQIINFNSEVVQSRSLYQDFTVNVSGSTATPGPPTWTPGPTTSPVPQPTTGGGCNLNFTDVHQGDVFYDVIKNMYCRQVVSGYSDNTFRPYANTMRGQLAKIVVLGFGFPINLSGGPHFTDVPPDNEFYKYVETAYNMHLVSGYDNRQFRPWDNVKRGQIAKIVVGAAEQANGWPAANPASPSFSDVPKSNVFYSFIETAKAHDLIAGCATGRFCIDDLAKRGQLAKIISGALPAR